MAHYTPKVRSRRLVAEALVKQPDRVTAAKLKASDLETVRKTGQEAEDADREQKAQITTSSATVSERAAEVATLLGQEAEVRDTVAAVVDDLEGAGNLADARFLARISFARFRLRELKDDASKAAGAPDAAGSDEVAKKLEQVEREDNVTRLDGFAGFLGAIRAPGREAIVAELAERGFTAEALDAMRSAAKAYAERGQNRIQAADATARESLAVLAQTRKWRAIRRLVRRAVEGDAELERLFASC